MSLATVELICRPFIALRKVLHVKAVTQCAVLEQFSLFLVLSNKVCLVKAQIRSQQETDCLHHLQTLLAYPMESLVPSSHSTGPPPRGHQKLSDKHEVQYFACGQLSGRTLVVYLRKKGVSRNNERTVRHLVNSICVGES